MRCVPIRPFVDAPQMKNVPKSSQKSRDFAPSLSASSATVAGFGATRRARGDVRCAEWRKSDVARLLAHEQRDHRHRQRRRAGDDPHGPTPAVMLDHRREQRQKHELSGRGARRENAQRESASLDEPAIHDRGAEHDRRHSGPDADDDAPEQNQLPRPRDERREPTPTRASTSRSASCDARRVVASARRRTAPSDRRAECSARPPPRSSRDSNGTPARAE